MKVVGLITEYNPFHLGHKHHLNMSKNITKADYTIAIMSGSFVQRGEPSIVDKWTKAKIAVDNGVDLVLELPFIFATQGAELFAYGSIALLNSLNIVDYIAFGSELDNLNFLTKIANILVEEPPYYKKHLKYYIDLGNSFPVSRSNALEEYFSKYKTKDINSKNIKHILKMSNNILAIEYLKALKNLNSKIQPIAIKRIGSSYKENLLNNKIASATSIRNTILSSDNVNQIKKYVPSATYSHLIDYINKYESFNTLDNYNQIIHYLLRFCNKSDLAKIIDVEPGLENRLVEKSSEYNNINSFLTSTISKRHARTRIQRILIHLMTDLNKEIFESLLPHHPSYIRVLGTNKKGFSLLNKIKTNSTVPIITKFADYSKHNNDYLNQIIEFDKKATDLFFFGLDLDKPLMNMDYYTSPYIKKNK